MYIYWHYFYRNIFTVLGILFPFVSQAQTTLPWLKTIAPETSIEEIHTISSQAAVTVSDGLTYSTHTLFHDTQRAIFQRMYEDRTIAQGIEGKYVWTYDGEKETETSQMVGNFILGHQFHAQILLFDRLHPTVEEQKGGEFNGKACYALSTKEEASNMTFYYEKTGHPLGMKIHRPEDPDIVFSFANWREVSGVQLPFEIVIDDGERVFTYNFLNIEFNAGSLEAFRAPYAVLTEEQKLLRLHRIIMDDHFWGKTDGIKNLQNDSLIIVSAGEIFRVPGKEPDGMIDRIMASRDYTVYDDLVRPIVKVSEDGKLGWVIVQVSAEGVRFDEAGNPTVPLAFVCSWIELYEKVEGVWQMTGNVSNFQPEQQ